MKLYNTLTKKKDDFAPIVPGRVSLYHCGPTVYWAQHIGNMRAVFFADTIVRSLNYLGYKSNLVRNYTDVGHLQGDNDGDADTGLDRMEAGAAREGLTPEEIAQKYIDIYQKDIDALGTLPPNHSPRATDHIAEMIVMVEKLLAKDSAYVTEQAVYFDTSRAKDYTRLSGQKLEDLRSGSGYGQVADSQKKNPSDFALWFFKTGAHANALQTWDSPFESPQAENGRGFPGWHIECSAMSKHFLGETFDVHMGGIEHIPVHHTNEIAQSENANDAPYAHYWLHNEHLLVNGLKMAKSSGTAYTLNDIVAHGHSPLVLRYFFLQAHYRSQQNFTWEALEASSVAYNKLLRFIELVGVGGVISEKYKKRFIEKISDDCNTPAALATVFELLKDTSVTDIDKKSTILDFDRVLGLALGEARNTSGDIPDGVLKLAEKRQIAKESKDWAGADKLRGEIEKLGYKILDKENGFELNVM